MYIDIHDTSMYMYMYILQYVEHLNNKTFGKPKLFQFYDRDVISSVGKQVGTLIVMEKVSLKRS